MWLHKKNTEYFLLEYENMFSLNINTVIRRTNWLIVEKNMGMSTPYHCLSYVLKIVKRKSSIGWKGPIEFKCISNHFQP